jgi:DNA-binding NtrC family response regulator
VNKKSLALLESYPWPDNIRELQNVIERSVIAVKQRMSQSTRAGFLDNLQATGPSGQLGLVRKLPSSQEKAIIEAALTECQGQVSGTIGSCCQIGYPGIYAGIEDKVAKNR